LIFSSSASVDGLTSKAKETVQSAAGAMHNLTQSMNAISASSREVAGVPKSLDEIAFNTNIPAPATRYTGSGSGGVTGIAPRHPPTPPDVRFSAAGAC
jgi:hypothetical protein